MLHAIECQLKADYFARVAREWREVYIRNVADGASEVLTAAAVHSVKFYSNIAADFYRMAREAMGVE